MVKNDTKVFVVYKGIKMDDTKDRPIRRQIEVRPFNNDLEYLQGLVEGYLEHYVIDDGLDRLHIDMWINEEGKFQEGLKPTIALTHEGQLYDVIMGNCVFSKYNEAGETLGLNPKEMCIVIDWLNDQDIVGLISRDGSPDIPVLKVER